MDKWRAAQRAIACAVVVLVLAACTSDPGPVVTDTPSSAAPTVTDSPSPTASVDVFAALPDAAKSDDLDGAVATAEFFLEQYAPMFHTGDTRLWAALQTDQCAYCQDALDNVAALQANGWTAQGGEIEADSSTARATLAGDGSAQVKYRAHFANAYLTKDTATPELQEAEGDHEVFLELVLVDGGWRVNGVSVAG